jgi:hypothetical protein
MRSIKKFQQCVPVFSVVETTYIGAQCRPYSTTFE